AKRQSILDYMVWLKQADTLGIKLTDGDVRTALNQLAPLGIVVADEDGKGGGKWQAPLTGDKAKDELVLRKMFPNKDSDVDLKSLYRALRDEIRVSLAQGIILGERPGLFQAEEII